MKERGVEDLKTEVQTLFSWQGFKTRILRFTYMLVPGAFSIGAIFIFTAVLGDYKMESSLIRELGSRCVILVLGLCYIKVAVWSFRRGPIDLTRGVRATGAFINIVVAGIMVFKSSTDLSANLATVAPFLLWAGYILLTLHREKAKTV